MQLKSIKLTGFKSFADSTTLPFKKQICAVVGPNGCGKSNVIDAIRWVIGEGSAKQLRMKSMAEVIFNGTNKRAPLAMASVDLNFSNEDRTLLGEYAHYTDLCVRRQVSRDGQSSYFLNNTPCRRRDIIDIFLGTGLGPRSYAVIEQGMISRLIEAKPEEVRAYLEEAAGVSKYKERRRETENRIRHTKENIERLQDIIDEHEKQQRHLKRQANAAERYKNLKAEERELSGQCSALEWQQYSAAIDAFSARLEQAQTSIASKQANLGTIDNQVLQTKDNLNNSQTSLQQVQKRFYEIGSDVAKLEQQINHHRSQLEEWEKNLAEVSSQRTELEAACTGYKTQIQTLEQESSLLQPQLPNLEANLSDAKMQLEKCDAACEHWREDWEEAQASLSASTQQLEVLRTKQKHAADEIERLTSRINKLQHRVSQLDGANWQDKISEAQQNAEIHEQDLSSAKGRCANLGEEIEYARDALQDKQADYQVKQQQLQRDNARLAALQALQDNAMGHDNEQWSTWLAEQGLSKLPRLTQSLKIKSGWEHAVEAVLAPILSSICVENCDDFKQQLSESTLNELLLLAPTETSFASRYQSLADCVESDVVPEVLATVYIASSHEQAWQISKNLQGFESVITQDGLWLSSSWARSVPVKQDDDSRLLRASEIKSLQQTIPGLDSKVTDLKLDIEQSQASLRELEASRDDSYAEQREASDAAAQARADVISIQKQAESQQKQLSAAQEEMASCNSELNLKQSKKHDESAQADAIAEQIQTMRDAKSEKQQQWQSLRSELETARTNLQECQKSYDEFALRTSANTDQLALLEQMRQRDDKQYRQLSEREQGLRQRLVQSDSPIPEIESELQQKLAERLTIESELTAMQSALDAGNKQLAEFEKAQEAERRAIASAKEDLQQIKMQQQEQVVRQATVSEEMQASNFSPEQILSELDDSASLDEWQNRLQTKRKSIDRLGPINMAAIDEHAAVSERKEHLDQQKQDLDQALEMLEQAIGKIDRETKDKFKETFQKVNDSLQQLFPKVFGGGKAYLELSESDWLNAGVIIRAQPPGKRNSTIHMLSGGEKALTAISLVFSLFQLNPAPFCILDEVDAPLDDANVGRFCRLVKEISDKTQFIVVSHNKITISMAEQMLGVTMQEAGVSRVVSVDMQQAVAMADA